MRTERGKCDEDDCLWLMWTDWGYPLDRRCSCGAWGGTPARWVSSQDCACSHSHIWICCACVNVRAYHNTWPHRIPQSVWEVVQEGLKNCRLAWGTSSPSYHGFCIPNGWICLAYNCAILTIQILASQGVASVAHNHAIWIQHWHKLEYEFVSQALGHRRVAGYEVHQTLHHPRRWRLTGVHTCRYHNGFLALRPSPRKEWVSSVNERSLGWQPTRIWSSLPEGAVTVR